MAGSDGEKLARATDGVVAVGLTGALGAGKSTALRLFADLGARVLSADDAVHGLYEQPDVRQALLARFGDGIIGAAGQVDRPTLARLVLAEESQLRWLEAFIHPLVEREMRRWVRESPRGTVVVVEVPLLFDQDLGGFFDLTVTVEASLAEREARVHGARSAGVFEGFDDRQMTRDERVARADASFCNDGSLEELQEFVAGVYRSALARISAAPQGTRRAPA